MPWDQSNSMMPFTDSEAAACGSPGADQAREQAVAQVPMPNTDYPDGQRGNYMEKALGTGPMNVHPDPMDDIYPGMTGQGSNATVAPEPNYGDHIADEVSGGYDKMGY